MSSNSFGRVKALNIMLILIGITSLAYYLTNLYNKEVLKLISIFAARFGISSVGSIIYTYSVEVYPTVIRAKGLGINLLSCRIASCLAPVMIEFNDNTFIYFSAFCLFTSIFSFFLPETNNKQLKDDLSE